jgi:hypothetical protein
VGDDFGKIGTLLRHLAEKLIEIRLRNCTDDARDNGRNGKRRCNYPQNQVEWPWGHKTESEENGSGGC